MIDLNDLRKQIEFLLENHAYGSCSFLASKLVTLSNNESRDLYLLAKTYFLTEEPLRAVDLLEKNNLLQKTTDQNYLKFILLATQCYSKGNRSDEVLRVTDLVFGLGMIEMNDSSIIEFCQTLKRKFSRDSETSLPLLALLCLERGKAYEIQDNRKKSLLWMKLSLHLDVRCIQALDQICSAQLTPEDEADLMNSLKSNQCFSSPNVSWLQPVFECTLSKHDCSKPSDLRFIECEKISADKNGPSLAKDADILAIKAEARYFQRDSRGAYELTKQVFELDPSNYLRAALVHVAAMVELGKTTELFYFAHRQVKEYPRRALSWYTVGAYYYSAKKFDLSRRYFNKASNLDPTLMAAWIGSAHANAMHDESDRAMSIYRTTARLFPGSHAPTIGTAMEYLRTNNPALAQRYCEQALSLCDVDPAIFNELGIVYYRMKRFGEAVHCFQEALKRCKGLTERILSIAFESVTFNLAHAFRRAGQYSDAIETYKLGLARCPKSASGHASLGLAYHLNDRINLALDCYHVSLGIRPGDTIVEQLMEMALMDLYSQLN